MLKTKNLNTKNPKIKHVPNMLRYTDLIFTICRRNKNLVGKTRHNFQARLVKFTDQKKLHRYKQYELSFP